MISMNSVIFMIFMILVIFMIFMVFVIFGDIMGFAQSGVKKGGQKVVKKVTKSDQNPWIF